MPAVEAITIIKTILSENTIPAHSTHLKLPCKWAVEDLLSSQASYHISDQNAQCSLSASIPFQMPHPLQ